MSEFTYKNISDRDLTLIEVGQCKAGETIKSAVRIENPNFELVEAGEQTAPVANAAPAPTAPAPEVAPSAKIELPKQEA